MAYSLPRLPSAPFSPPTPFTPSLPSIASPFTPIVATHRPGNPKYRRDFSNSLTLRWSTEADRAGCALLACLAPGLREGQENEYAVRYFDAYMNDDYHAGSATNWAVCVDRSANLPKYKTPQRRSPSLNINTQVANESEYITSMRKDASDAPERVVALIYFLRAEFSFEKDAARVGLGKAQIVACHPEYRRRDGAENIMKGLFAMVHDRAILTGCALTVTSGIPAYYRTHGYEYGLRLGPTLITPTEVIQATTQPITNHSLSLRLATQNDLPAIERLVNVTRDTSTLFYSIPDTVLRAQLTWLLGHRAPPFDASPVYQTVPFYVLEKRGIVNPEEKVIVAAAGLQNRPSTSGHAPSAAIHPLLWNGEGSGPEIVSVLVQKLYHALNEELRKEGGDRKLAKISWVIAEGHPLRKWLLARQIANVGPESSLYDSHGNWWINIPSLPLFFKHIAPALNARLAASAHELGAEYTGELHISQLSMTVQGALIRILKGRVVAVESNLLTADDIHAAAFSQGGPNVCLPRAALIQLIMGYKSWKELKAIFPDVIIHPSVLPVVEILFPRLTFGSSLYF